MKASHWPRTLGLLALVPAMGLALDAVAQPNTMGFFVTSSGSGQGADLGGLAGADARCQSLAQAAGAGGRTWRAYLSTSGAGGGECAGPHRPRPLAQCQGRGHRQ